MARFDEQIETDQDKREILENEFMGNYGIGRS